MRETSGEFSAREANRQGQGRRELAEHCSESILATGTPSPEAQGEAQSRFAIWRIVNRFTESVTLPMDIAMRKFMRESPNLLDHFGARFHECVRLHRPDSVWRRIRNRRNNYH
jgi:hypothetical protein